MPKLTKTTVEREQPSDKERFLWDTELKGFGLKVFPSGAKSFVFQYRTAEGQTKRLTIGKLSDSLTTEQARKLARDFAFDVHAGGDPQGVKKARRESLTVNDLLDEYLSSPAFASKAESTKAVDRGRIDRHVRPLLGKEFADKLTPDDVKRAHKAVTEGKTAAKVKTKARGLARVSGGEGTANKAVLALSAAFKWGVEQHLVKANPAGKMKCWQTGQRDTILSDAADYKRMFTALQELEDEKRIRAPAADAIRFIALTGARRGEVTGLLWKWIDLKAGIVTLPPKAHKAGHKTGKPRVIALPAEAQAIIARQPAGKPDDYVFAPAKGDGPLSISHDWPKVRERAALPANLGLHGLRHSIGTHLAMAGASAVELMETLGHRQVTTTLRYIHFAERARSTLAERAAAVAVAGLKGEPDKAEVVQIAGGKK